MTNEIRRIRQVYERRAPTREANGNLHSHAGDLFMAQQRERALSELLRRNGIADLADARILDVGCGRGARLTDWSLRSGGKARLYGVDLMEAFIRDAATVVPQAGLFVASAAQLPFAQARFDIVSQFVVFSSILDSGMRHLAAAEMQRVLAPHGVIIWYDMRYSNPRNTDTRPVPMREIQAMFPGWAIDAVSVTLLPPLARRLARWSASVCRILEKALPPARSHILAVIRRQR